MSRGPGTFCEAKYLRYTDELIEEIRSRNDIVDVISAYVKLTRRGSSYFGLCPFHNEKTASFSVTPAKQMFYCFGCGAGGNVITFLMKYENFSFAEALKVLADRAGIALPEPDRSREAEEREERRRVLLEVQKTAAGYFYRKLRQEGGARAMTYLRGRGLTDETMKNFGLGYADKYSDDLYRYIKTKEYPDDILMESGLFSFDEKRGFSDKFWNRIMFPIMDANSRVIGFGGRVMGEGEPKYLNSPETPLFDKSRNLYGLHVARRTRKKQMIICEGYMDVISMHQAGYTNAVASLGTALTSQQCSLLSRFTREVLLIYDMDDAGVRAALRAIPMLRDSGIHAKVVDLAPCKDPDEFIKMEGAEAFAERLKKAENSFLFEIRMLERDYDLADPQGKSDFFHAVSDRIMELRDEIERDSYAEAIARNYQISKEDLLRIVARRALAADGKKMIRAPGEQTKRRAERASGLVQSQKLMLTWLASYPGLGARLQPQLKPEDFPTPLYRKVAGMIEQQQAEGEIRPAEIISHFDNEEQQTEVASIFHTELLLDSEEEKRKALEDVLFRLKEGSLKARSKQIDRRDIEAVRQMTEEKKQLDRLKTTGLPKNILEQGAGGENPWM